MNTYKISGLILHTSYDCAPIPYRHMDWSCVDDDYDGAPDAGVQLHGTGKTEIEAILDYMEQYINLKEYDEATKTDQLLTTTSFLLRE